MGTPRSADEATLRPIRWVAVVTSMERSDDPYCAEHGERFNPAIGCRECLIQLGLCIACGKRPIERGVECGPCYRAGDRRQGIKTWD